MRTPDERLIGAARMAFADLNLAIDGAEDAVGIAMRLRSLEAPFQARKEYLVQVLASLYEVRDVMEQALPPVAVADEEERDG